MIDQIQKTLSHYQEIMGLGPLIVSPAKALVSAAELVTGIAMEVFFGTLTSVVETFEMNELASCFDDLCHEGVDLRKKGGKNLISALFNIITFGTQGVWMEEQLGLRFKASRI